MPHFNQFCKVSMANSKDIVLITGCGSGIGMALAQAFHAKGHTVCATARRPDSIAGLAADKLLVRALDVTDAAAIEALLTGLHEDGYSVGTLINNAGYGAMGPVMDIPAEEWQRQFDVNLFAPMALTRAVLPDMVARARGLVVNISSVSGVVATPFAAPYCASKAALNAASDALRMELRPLGIRVVTVQPGGIRSSFGHSAAGQVSLGEASPYQAIRDGVSARANDSQTRAMPAQAFARLLEEALARPDCPAVIRLGEKSRLLPRLKWLLPTRSLDAILSRRYQLDRLAR
jgi:short-subunit dehydrogenase